MDGCGKMALIKPLLHMHLTSSCKRKPGSRWPRFCNDGSVSQHAVSRPRLSGEMNEYSTPSTTTRDHLRLGEAVWTCARPQSRVPWSEAAGRNGAIPEAGYLLRERFGGFQLGLNCLRLEIAAELPGCFISRDAFPSLVLGWTPGNKTWSR